jgi:hypothetical protein
MKSVYIGWSNAQHLGRPLHWTIQGSNDDITFDDIQDYTSGTGSYNVTNPHIPYMYWRVLITLVDPKDGSSAAVPNVTCNVYFTTVESNIKVASAFQISTTEFKINMVDYAGFPVNITTGVGRKFNILLTKNGKVANEGLYTFTAPTGFSKAN